MSSMDFDKTGSILDSGVVDNDVHVKLQEVMTKLLRVEADREKLQKEKEEQYVKFNEQRAQLHRLYMVKEKEVERLSELLDDAENKAKEEQIKTQAERIAELSQIVQGMASIENKAREEEIKTQVERIAELSQIVQDTVEESSSSQSQVKLLQKSILVLEEQLSRTTAERGENLLLAPSNMISATKSFAKKVVSHLGSDVDKSGEDLEDSMRKAKEETDVMRALIMPLEGEIAELKNKLKISEDKVIKYEKKLFNQEHTDGSGTKLACDMCLNYEEQLQSHQEKMKAIEKQKDIVESNLEKFKEDLAKETQFRKEMEEKWNEKKEEQKLQVKQLKDEVVAGKSEFHELQSAFEDMKASVKEELDRLRFDREKINAKMQKLQKENENLLGKHSKNSAELDSEFINYPDNVDELQDLLLKLRQDFLQALVAREVKEEELNTLKCEMQLLQSDMKNEQSNRAVLEDELTTENSKLKHESDMLSRECKRFKTEITDLSMREIERKAELESTKDQLRAISEANKQHLVTIGELKNCVGSLQEQLDNSEAVQKDFVRLSQSLQIELEKIRKENTEVRWQHDDDVIDCQGCKETFPSPKKKGHCRHCGKIFCSVCLQHTVKSGPNQKASHVCQVCHTLLNSETAPYFSQDPPHSCD